MAIDRNRRPKPGRHDVPLPADYRVLLTDVKSRIRAAQLRASLSVNQELIQLYWDIGRLIVHRQQAEGWGAAVIDRLASDARRRSPGWKAFRQIFRA
jgi:predicted nuclease of restriction endonuclease-like (RecB) superfamily